MAEYKLTNKAVDDLNGIWDYTVDEWSDLGKNYDVITTDLFGLKANRHIIFYRKTKSSPIEITRIFHGRMDLKNKLTE